jgi:hypothetical protein
MSVDPDLDEGGDDVSKTELFHQECKQLAIQAMLEVQRRAAILTMPSVPDLLGEAAYTGNEAQFRAGLCTVIRQLMDHLSMSLQAECDMQDLLRGREL